MTDHKTVREALEAAASFIKNGVALGYITLPDVPCDPALQTASKIHQALAALDRIEAQPADAQRQAALLAFERIIVDIQDPDCEGVEVDDYYTVKAALQSPAVQQQQPTNARRQEALDDLDLLEKIGWFPEQDEAGLAKRFERIRAALKFPVVPSAVATLWLLAGQCSTHFVKGIDQTKQIKKTIFLLKKKGGAA